MDLNTIDNSTFIVIKLKKYLEVCLAAMQGYCSSDDLLSERGWLGGAMVLGKLPVPGRPTFWITVGQGPIALAVTSACIHGFPRFSY